MVYTLEAIQAHSEVTNVHGRVIARSALPEIHACTDPNQQRDKMDAAARDLRGMDRRRRIIATLLIGCYILTVAFVQAMAAIVSMYGGAPDTVTQSGWIMLTGALCLVLDLVHIKFGVEVVLEMYEQGSDSCSWQRILSGAYGSIFVILEATLVMVMSGGGFIDPILVLLFAACIAASVTDMVVKSASALQFQAWMERV